MVNIMVLTKNEAICLVLGMAKDNKISSITKMNKLVARLNLFLISTEINFSLNKYGSFNADLLDLKENDFFENYYYNWEGRQIKGFKLTERGEFLVKKIFKHKLKKILNETEIEELKEKFFSFSQLSANDLSQDEHKKLLVDEEDVHQLRQRINLVNNEFIDLYEQIDKIPEDSIENIRLGALVEFCYHLSNYLANKVFKNIEDDGYNFDAHMHDYYLLKLMEESVNFIQQQMKTENKDKIKINRYHQYIKSVKNYPFSLNNPNLLQLAQ